MVEREGKREREIEVERLEREGYTRPFAETNLGCTNITILIQNLGVVLSVMAVYKSMRTEQKCFSVID